MGVGQGHLGDLPEGSQVEVCPQAIKSAFPVPFYFKVSGFDGGS